MENYYLRQSKKTFDMNSLFSFHMLPSDAFPLAAAVVLRFFFSAFKAITMSIPSREEEDNEVAFLLHQQEEGEQKEEGEEEGGDTASWTSQPPGGEKVTVQRLRWMTIPENFSGSGAKKNLSIFLSDKNEKDIVLARHLMAERPYTAERGVITETWDTFADICNEDSYLHNKVKGVFGSLLKGKNCKGRFLQLMDFAKKISANVPFRSGDDSEPPPTELQSAIEGIYEDYVSHQHVKKSSRNDILAAKERDKAAAEIIRRSAVGLPLPRLPANHPNKALSMLECIITENDDNLPESLANYSNVAVGASHGVAEPPDAPFNTPAAFARAPQRTTSSSGLSGNGRVRSGASTPVPQTLEVTMGPESQQAALTLKAENKKRKLELDEERLRQEKGRHEERVSLENKRIRLEEQKVEQQKKQEDNKMEHQKVLDAHNMEMEARRMTLEEKKADQMLELFRLMQNNNSKKDGTL